MATVDQALTLRIYFHLGYPMGGTGASLAGGVISVVVLQPLVRKQLEILPDEAVSTLREVVSVLDGTWSQIDKLALDARAKQLGNLQPNPNALRDILRIYSYQLAQLEAVLGGANLRNPQDPRQLGGLGSAGSATGTAVRRGCS